ncbi:unnamed protein product [Heligmosomoides polygyrus]|uniref:Secreted protein n=1 Tax=Heligmosomoides polygyrus TaxID=6339 RepID=A0A183FER9_HELPZ|nr:unnamed protein product [Heligmosomoides polygyrus]
MDGSFKNVQRSRPDFTTCISSMMMVASANATGDGDGDATISRSAAHERELIRHLQPSRHLFTVVTEDV